jgi:hypothetical protein
MSWIERVSVEEATGVVAQEYAQALRRSGGVAGIVSVMSLNGPALASAMRLYRDVMFRESPLSRSQRELLATAVSVFNDCHY